MHVPDREQRAAAGGGGGGGGDKNLSRNKIAAIRVRNGSDPCMRRAHSAIHYRTLG